MTEREYRLRKRIDALTDDVDQLTARCQLLERQLASVRGHEEMWRRRCLELDPGITKRCWYASEEERVDARRRTWRESQQRRRAREHEHMNTTARLRLPVGGHGAAGQTGEA